MNLLELARMDAMHTVEGEQAGKTVLTFTDLEGGVYVVGALLSDIGHMTDTDGNTVAGRTCWATYIADRVSDDNDNVLVPRAGWKACWLDAGGTEQKSEVLFAEPDRTLGITKVFMTMDLV